MAPHTATAVPSRHPRDRRKVPMVGLLAKAMLIGPPTDAEWRTIGAALNAGDRPMDDLVDWMYAQGMDSTRPLFNQAMAQGICSVENPPEPLHTFFTHVEATPDWVDWRRIRSGQRFFQRGGLDTIFLARDVPFLGGFAASGINRTLLLTKTGQSGESGSAQRFAETMQWALSTIADDGLSSQGSGYQATLHVRMIHAFVRRHVGALPEWQAGDWGTPVNQTDMAATILGAIYVPAVLSLTFGIVATPRELDDVAHLTRYVGWLMGVEEQYLPVNFRDAMKRLYHYLMSLHRPDETSRAMAVPMANDPLHWRYSNFEAIRRRIAWAQHISITSTYIGRAQMRRLGLPTYMPPWYPMLRIPVNLLRTGANFILPGGRLRQARSGSRRQYEFMHALSADGHANIGHSASWVGHAA
ncbi:oxygenase MpaB family protein [Mycobacteriaceae bacterium NPDC060252]